MKNKDEAIQAGAKAFFSGKFRGSSGLSGWRLENWLKGWDLAHNSEIKK